MSTSGSAGGSRPASTSSSLLQGVPGAFPDRTSSQATTQQSLSQTVRARRAEYTRPKNIKIKVGTWNTATCKGTEKDIGGWFIQGQGVAEALTGLSISGDSETLHESAKDNRESVNSQEERYRRKSTTLPKNDPGSVLGGDEIDLYLLGLQEIVDVNSASEALRPFTDPAPSGKWKEAIENVLPSGFVLVAEQQLIGLLLLIYASPRVAPDIKSVSTTSVGTGLMGYMGNKGAVTARIVLGETTRIVLVNCHMAAGNDKTSLERRNWDYSQILNRTRFEPIQDSMDIIQSTGETIDDADITFWVGDLNYRLTGIPGDDIRRLLMLHTRNEYDLSQASSQKLEQEIIKTKISLDRQSRPRSSTSSTTSTVASAQSSIKHDSRSVDEESMTTYNPEDALDPESDPASLHTTISSLLPHDELLQQQKSRKAFHNGWREGPITFLPTYKYDIGSVGVFDSGEKRRAPSWCDRILFRTRRDKLLYESMIAEEEESRKKDAEMTKHGLDDAGKDEELLYDYDPDTDAIDDSGSFDEFADAPEDVVITKEGFEDKIVLDSYTAHQRVLSSDHKPLDAVFSLKYDAIIPELKAKVHAEVARELDKAENETRPSVTVVVDPSHSNEPEITDEDPARFEGVYFGSLRYAQHRHRSLTIANTGRVAASVSFIQRPVGAGQQPGLAPAWLSMKMDEQPCEQYETQSIKRHLEPGEVCNVDLSVRLLDPHLVRALNEGIKQLDDILVLRVEEGRDHFIPIRGKWVESSVGRSISKLIRIPEGGIRKLQRQKPKGDRSETKGSPEDLPVRWSAPRELFLLTHAAETLTEASIAEWGMTANDQRPPWGIVAGWPFVQDSWTASTEEERLDGIAVICDAVDSSSPIEACLEPDTSQMQRLEYLAAFLIDYVRNIHDGVVTEQQWHEVDAYLARVEGEKKPTPLEDQRTCIQEILSQSPPHSISFILLTSMLDRIVNEITSGSGQFQLDSESALPRMPNAVPAIKKKDLSKDLAVACRQIVTRALAAVVSDAMIRAPTPTKDRDKATYVERRIRLVSIFLTKDEP